MVIDLRSWSEKGNRKTGETITSYKWEAAAERRHAEGASALWSRGNRGRRGRGDANYLVVLVVVVVRSPRAVGGEVTEYEHDDDYYVWD
jgi:hypothetical protein